MTLPQNSIWIEKIILFLSAKPRRNSYRIVKLMVAKANGVF